MFPKADVPVVQLSISALQPIEYHLKMGVALAELRRRGVLVLGSGNVVHNLSRLNRAQAGMGADWAERFDDAAQKIAVERPGDMLQLLEHPDYARAAPTPEHFIPLLYLGGMAARDGAALTPFNKGYDLASLSMTCYALGLDAELPA